MDYCTSQIMLCNGECYMVPYRGFDLKYNMSGWRYLNVLLLVLVILPFKTLGGRLGWINRFWSLEEAGDNSMTWAVLVAGSNEYYNYRHQADVCHAYQILKRGGLKDEKIIVFMYDDIAMNELNPKPGVIINNPKGGDVYSGVPKDYTEDTVTAENFYAVLLGDKKSVKGGSGKVVDSKPNDRIFVYYTDHGGPGSLGMPNPPFVYANDFNAVLKKKHAAGTYKEMVIYVESCEGGSIFEGLLPENLNIYVTTASNADENSWATYCPDTTPPPPPEYDTCLGDLYSVAWMEDSDKENLESETLQEQYQKVKVRAVNGNYSEGSHVMQYGTKTISSESVSQYQGSSTKSFSGETFQFNGPAGVVNQRGADVYFLQRKYEKSAEGSQQKADILKQITDITTHRSHLDDSINKIGEKLFGPEQGLPILSSSRGQGSPLVDDWGCLKSMVRLFETHCGLLTQYGMKHMRAFANICNNGVPSAAVEEASIAACKGYNMGQWNPANGGYSA